MGNRRKTDLRERARKTATTARDVAVTGLRLLGAASAAALVCGGGYAAFVWVTESETFAVRRIDVHGAGRVPAAEVRRLSGLAEGENLFRADLSYASAAVAEHPWIREVRARRELPDAIVIEVEERVPAALVELENLYLVDDRGEVFKRAMPGDPLDLPVITGLTRDTWATGGARDDLLNAISLLTAHGKSDVSALPVAEVHLDGSGLTAYLGKASFAARLGEGDYPAKLARLSRVLAEAKKRGQELSLIHLDNRVRPGWVAARPKGKG